MTSTTLMRKQLFIRGMLVALFVVATLPAGGRVQAQADLPEVSGWSLGPPLLSGVSEQAVAAPSIFQIFGR